MKIDPRSSIVKVLATCIILLYLHASAGVSLASFTIQDEKKLGKEFYDKLKDKGVFVKEPKVTVYIERIGRLLLSHSERAFFDFTFSVIDSPGINAFATPGGYVYVYKGLIELTEDENQLAGVLAHEIAHIKARHIAQAIENAQKINLASLAAILAGAFLGGGGEMTAAVVGFSTATAASLNLKYSREHEEEADRLGMLYLTETGYDGEGMLNFLKIMRQYEFYSNSVPSYFLTHPGTSDRIRYLDGLLQTKYKERGPKNIIGRLERIKTILVISREAPDSGIRYFQNALKKNPNNPDALYGLAVIQGMLGKTSESFANFHKALSLSPDDADILRDMGISYFNLGKVTDATEALQGAYRADREDADTTWYLGRAYDAIGDYSGALTLYKEFLKKNPDDSLVYYNLAMLYGKLNMKGESHYHFGIFFKKERKFKSALFHIKAAQPFFPPGSEMAEKIKENIDSIEKDFTDHEKKR
ncbi:MAG: tetratricopeptide repeat protein [Syntrophobacterales bacterium]|nr:MAG: tetratricopeptide repeat protein [Syntrophobacterales bacterium]